MSRARANDKGSFIAPGSAMFKHSVKDSEQLTHTGGKGYFIVLPCGAETLIKGSDDGIMPCGCQCSHVQGGSYFGSPSPNGALASEVAAITVKGSYTNQGSYLLTIQCAQFGKISQEGGRKDRAYPGNALQQVVFLSPNRASSDAASQVVIEFGQFPLQPGDVILDKFPYNLAVCGSEAIPLRCNHLHHLTPAGQETA